MQNQNEHNQMPTITQDHQIDMIDKKNVQNLNIRKHIMFNYDEELEKMQTKLHTEFMNRLEEKNN